MAEQNVKPGTKPNPAHVLLEWDLDEQDAGAASMSLADLFPWGFELLDDETMAEAGPRRSVYRLYVPEDRARPTADRLRDLSTRLADSNVISDPGRVRLLGPVNRNWADRWKTHFEIQRVGSFVIAPPWKQNELDPRPDDRTLVIEPGQAFGTGQHPTTRLCLEAMNHLHQHGLVPASVLDFGCGSGILAMAAALLWPEPTKVVAVDNDPLAVEATEENARRNHLADRLVVLPATPSTAGLDVDVNLDPSTFDLILANVRLNVLQAQAHRLLGLLTPDGTVVLSGLFDEDPDISDDLDDLEERPPSEQLLQTWRSLSPRLEVPRTLDDQGWVCLVVNPNRTNRT